MTTAEEPVDKFPSQWLPAVLSSHDELSVLIVQRLEIEGARAYRLPDEHRVDDGCACDWEDVCDS